MRCSVLAALLLSAAALSAASAARAATWDLARRESGGNGMQALQWMISSMRATDDLDKGRGKRMASVVTKYEVMPGLHNKFIDEWQRLEQCVRDEEKGNIIYDLKKYVSDNMNFIVYGEWESMEDLVEHSKSKCTEEFLDFVCKEDIQLEMYPLMKVTDDVMNIRERKGQKVEHRGRRHEDTEDMRDGMAHVMIEYHVPPSKTDDFVNMWDKVADVVADEKENTIYSLRKVVTMNHHYVIYGTWENFDAYLDHTCSKHVMKLKEFAADNNLLWYIEPLRKYGKEREE